VLCCLGDFLSAPHTPHPPPPHWPHWPPGICTGPARWNNESNTDSKFGYRPCDQPPGPCSPYTSIAVRGGMFVATNGNNAGSIVSLRCFSGFALPTNVTTNSTCDEDGYWSVPLEPLATVCTPEPCEPLAQPPGGFLVFNGNKTSRSQFYTSDRVQVRVCCRGCVGGPG
jgi:hypothetical protein